MPPAAIPPAADPIASLEELLRPMRKVLIGYSGGVDSTFLLYSCVHLLGADSVVAVVVDHPLMREGALSGAIRIGVEIGADVRIESIDLLQIEEVSNNSPERCYHCKRRIFGKLTEMARSEGISYVLDGSNADDPSEYRPGLVALEELDIRSPLKEAGLTKGDIRDLSRKAGLPTWDKPSAPCLATRFPYGAALLKEEIDRVREGERLLIAAGYSDLRLRVHPGHGGAIARLELPPGDFRRLLASGSLDEIVASLKGLGYRYVTLDLEGLRSGNMDD